VPDEALKKANRRGAGADAAGVPAQVPAAAQAQAPSPSAILRILLSDDSEDELPGADAGSSTGAGLHAVGTPSPLAILDALLSDESDSPVPDSPLPLAPSSSEGAFHALRLDSDEELDSVTATNAPLSAAVATLKALLSDSDDSMSQAPPIVHPGTTTSGQAARRGRWTAADFESFGDPEQYLSD
jgi:hypothetical protein